MSKLETTRLEAIRGRIDGVETLFVEPWIVENDDDFDDEIAIVTERHGAVHTPIVDVRQAGDLGLALADFIAHARDDIIWLLQRAAAGVSVVEPETR